MLHLLKVMVMPKLNFFQAHSLPIRLLTSWYDLINPTASIVCLAGVPVDCTVHICEIAIIWYGTKQCLSNIWLNYSDLVGGFNPSENSSQFGWLFPIYGKKQTTNQWWWMIKTTWARNIFPKSHSNILSSK
jgi:hypothetical protein